MIQYDSKTRFMFTNYFLTVYNEEKGKMGEPHLTAVQYKIEVEHVEW